MANSDYTEKNIARLLEALADEPVHADPAFRSQLRARLHAEVERQALPWWRRFSPKWGLAAASFALVAVVAVCLLIGVLVTPAPDTPTLLTVHDGSVVVRQTRSSLLGVTRETTRTVHVGESLQLAQGDRVIAASGARAVLTYPDESWSELEGGADVILVVVQPATAKKPMHISLQVWAGSTRHHVEQTLEADAHFEVETATGVASVRRGDLYVTVLSADHTYLETDEGEVSVAQADGRTTKVPPGYQANMLLNQPLNVRPRPPRLTQISAGGPAELKLTGQTVAGATLLLYAQGEEAACFIADDQGRFSHVFEAPTKDTYPLQLATVGVEGQVSDLSDLLVWIYDPALSTWLRLVEPAPEAGEAWRAYLGGQAPAGATVTVNGTLARVATDGSFETMVALESGYNALPLLITDSAGEHTALELEVVLARDVDGRIDLHATLTLQPDPSPPAPADAPGFGIAKSAPAQVRPGQVFTYTLVVQNRTGITPTTTIITDVLPTGADPVAGTVSHGGVLSGRVITWTVTNLAHGATVTRTFCVTATTTRAAIVNDAYGVNGGRDWITTTLGEAVTVYVPQLVVTKRGPGSVEPGQVFSYTLTITNHTFDALHDLIISDTLPLGVRYKRAEPPGNWISASRTLTWAVASLSCSHGEEIPLTSASDYPGGVRGCQGLNGARITRTIVVTAPDIITVVVNSDYAAWASAQVEPGRGAPVSTVVGNHLPIYLIQGRGFRSPMVGETVKIVGVLVGLDPLDGFYLQAPAGDGDETTSDGILVSYPSKLNPGLYVGALVTVTGSVGEFSQEAGLACKGNGCQTQIYVHDASAIEIGEGVVPAATELNPPGDPDQAALYWESREGMLVTLPHTSTVVGATSLGDVMVVRGDLAVERVLRAGPYSGMPVGVRSYQGRTPYTLTVGSVIENVDGPLAQAHGHYTIITQPGDAWRSVYVRPAPPQAPSWPKAKTDEFSVATFNTLDFDTASGVKADKVVATIVRLGCPTFLALQEVDVGAVMPDLLRDLRSEGCLYNYAYSRADADGLGIALLWRTGRARNVTWSTAQSCSAHGDPSALHDPLWDHCQSLGADVYPLFSRRPVILTATVPLGDSALPLTVIANHFGAERQRLEQGQFVAELVDDAVSPYVIVLGDLNDWENSPPLERLYAGGSLVNTWSTLPGQARYSYVYQGVSQARDHILVSPALAAMLQNFGPLHYNTDYLYGYGHDGDVVWRTSDHDPLAATFARPVLHITKTVESAHTPVRLGDTVTYTLVVANREHKDARVVRVSDVLPPGVSGANLDWTGTITANAQVEFSLQAVVTTNAVFYGQTIENTAYYSYTGVRGSDSASFVVESAPAPSLTIAKRVETPREPVRPGDSITYTIRVENDGGQVATGVDLVDVLPPGVDFAAWVISPTHTSVADDVILWEGRVSVGQVLTWTFVARATGAQNTIVVNKASVQCDGGLGEASAAFTFEPEPPASIVINEIMTSPAVVLDSEGEWIELYNAGSSPVDLNGCVLRDDGADSHVIDNGGPLVINPGAYLVLGNNDNPTSNGGVAVIYAYTGLNLENIADQVVLECGGRQVDRVDYDSGSDRPGLGGASMQLVTPALDNNVSANWCKVTTAWPGGAGDGGTPGTANNCPLADLSITKTVTTARAPQTPVLPGDALTYTIVVANDGEVDATTVHVRDVLPSGLAGANLDQVIDVAAGDRKTFVIPTTVATATNSYAQTIVNTAYYHHSSGSGSDSASVDVELGWEAPGLRITKTVESVHNPVRLGDPVAYTITVANKGDVAATGVVMSDVLPLGLSLGGCLRDECTARLLPPGNALHWNLGVVPAGQSHTIRFVATLTTSVAFYGETVTNTVTYTSANAGGGASDVAFVIEPSFLSITTTVEPAHAPVQRGDPITYTIVVANHSDDNAHSVVITDDLPAAVRGADLNWSGTVTANDRVEFTIQTVFITDAVYYDWSIVNTAYYSHTSGGGSDDAILIVQAPHRVFLPIIPPKR